MRTVEWTAKAEQQLASWIDHLAAAAGPHLAERAYREARRKADSLARFSGYRPSRWSGYQEMSLTPWRKIIVFRQVPGRVIIVALYDMRQDLDAVSPDAE